MIIDERELSVLSLFELAAKLKGQNDESKYHYRHAGAARARKSRSDEEEEGKLLDRLAEHFAAKQGRDANELSRRLYALLYRG